MDAMPTLAQLVQHAQARISVMACGELSTASVKAVISYTHVREVHAGLNTTVTSADEVPQPEDRHGHAGGE